MFFIPPLRNNRSTGIARTIVTGMVRALTKRNKQLVNALDAPKSKPPISDARFRLPGQAKKKILDQIQEERDNRMIVIRFGLYNEATLDLIAIEELQMEFVGHNIKDIFSVWQELWKTCPQSNESYMMHLINAAYINDEKVDFSYVLQRGDVLEFVIEPSVAEVQ